jgi:hypothetical protein
MNDLEVRFIECILFHNLTTFSLLKTYTVNYRFICSPTGISYKKKPLNSRKFLGAFQN